MSIIDKKKKVFGKIAATRTLTEGLPQFKLTSSMPSINNRGNSVEFLSDLTKSLTLLKIQVESARSKPEIKESGDDIYKS
jgi:hypothetical protein